MEETKTMSRPTATMGRETKSMQGSTGERVHISIGTEINGYAITSVIAENTGEAALFLCTKDGGQYVAKVYHANKKPKPEILNAIRAITSPYIIKTVDDGEYAGRFFEILPYFSHGDLQKAAPLDADFVAATVVPNLNEALFVLHEKGIVHRDIKPNNTFFSDDKSRVIVGDFGISSVVAADSSVRLTTASRTLGYAAPETANGFVSKESDFYSFGIALLHLLTGQDPFAGMTEYQILAQTINYKLDIPQSVPPRIAHLIKGLTIKERTDRWGYAEVKKWLNNETVEIRESVHQNSDIKPYMFGGRKDIYGLDDLALLLAANWDEGIKHLYRGLLRDHMKQFGQDLASKTMDYEEERDKDIGFFKFIYTANPNAPLCWRGAMFADVGKLGEHMKKELPAVNSDYRDLLKSGALAYFLEAKGYGKDLINEVKKLQQLAEKDIETAYYKLAFLLTQDGEFIFRKNNFDTVDELVSYLYEQRDKVEDISKELVNNKYFFAWLEYLGFSDHIARWKKIEY